MGHLILKSQRVRRVLWQDGLQFSVTSPRPEPPITLAVFCWLEAGKGLHGGQGQDWVGGLGVFCRSLSQGLLSGAEPSC